MFLVDSLKERLFKQQAKQLGEIEADASHLYGFGLKGKEEGLDCLAVRRHRVQFQALSGRKHQLRA